MIHGRPGIDHRPGPHVRADVDVARHEHRSCFEKRAVSGNARRNDAHPGRVEAVLEGDLVVELERAHLDSLHFRSAKKSKIACLTQG